MAADIPALIVAVCDLYQRWGRCLDRRRLDHRPHRLHDWLYAIGAAAQPGLLHPGTCHVRAASGGAGCGGVADRASLILGRGAAQIYARQSSGTARTTGPEVSRFRVQCGASHRAALRADPMASPGNDAARHLVSGQPLSLAVKKALSPGTTAICL